QWGSMKFRNAKYGRSLAAIHSYVVSSVRRAPASGPSPASRFFSRRRRRREAMGSGSRRAARAEADLLAHLGDQSFNDSNRSKPASKPKNGETQGFAEIANVRYPSS